MAASLRNADYASDRLTACVQRILNTNELCSMATINESGRLHINTAFFAFDEDWHLYFLSNPVSVHARNIAAVPQMAATVFDTHQRWGTNHRGLQLFGEAALMHTAKAAHVYSSRFPAYKELVKGASVRDLRFYRFTPATIKILDEEEFGDQVYVVAEVNAGVTAPEPRS